MQTLTRFFRRLRVALWRFWRLGTSNVLAYRLQTTDHSHIIGRVVDSQIKGEHLFITDLDGSIYVVQLAEVRSFIPVRAVPSQRYLGHLQVVGE